MGILPMLWSIEPGIAKNPGGRLHSDSIAPAPE
jgi:hypothetical protein